MSSFLVDADHRRCLERLGLDSLEACLAFEGGELVKAARPGRDVRRLRLSEVTYFLKRIRGRSWREIPHEAKTLSTLEIAGLPVPTPVAVGAERRAAVLVTLGLPVVTTLEQVILNPDCDPARASRLLLDAVSLLVRLHAAGINHRDYYAGHLLLDEKDHLMLIDLGRAEVRRRVPSRRAVKDLAALESSVPPRILAPELRRELLRQYLGSASNERELARWDRAIASKRERMRAHAATRMQAGKPNFHVNH